MHDMALAAFSFVYGRLELADERLLIERLVLIPKDYILFRHAPPASPGYLNYNKRARRDAT